LSTVEIELWGKFENDAVRTLKRRGLPRSLNKRTNAERGEAAPLRDAFINLSSNVSA
jgi:hypothetical protein